MEDKKPGQASVQYGDMRGEAAGDVSDRFYNLPHDAARELGFNGHGFVVGISIYGGDELRADPNLVHVTFQVIDGPLHMGEVNRKLAESDGVLEVTEYRKDDVPVVDFMGCFKRLELSLFHRHIKAHTIRVVESIHMKDAEG